MHYRDIVHNEKPGGIEKKVAAQIKAFNAAGLACDFIFCRQPETVASKILSCLPFMPDGVNWPDPQSMSDYSFIYIRRPRFASRELIRFIEKTKRVNPDIKIIYEIPTYPYDAEMKTPILYSALIKDRINRKKLRTNVNRAAILTDEEEVFGIKTVKIMNGIDLSRITPKEPASALDEVHIIAVACFERWHGLDRLIAGIIAYYQKPILRRKVVLHVAGTGSILGSLKRQVEAANLRENIIFHGYCDSEELDALYDRCSLAVESLGFHRRAGLSVSASLKSREYLAKGIPFVSANEVDVFIDNPVDFFQQIPSNEDPVDIKELLSFHDRLYASETPGGLIGRIRGFAETHVEMDKAMENVISYLDTIR